MRINNGKLYKYTKSNEFEIVIKVLEIENELQVSIETINHPDVPKGHCLLLSLHTIQNEFVQLPDDHPLSVLYGG